MTNLVPGLFLFLPLQSRDDRSGTTEEVHAGNEWQIKVSVSIGTFTSPSGPSSRPPPIIHSHVLLQGTYYWNSVSRRNRKGMERIELYACAAASPMTGTAHSSPSQGSLQWLHQTTSYYRQDTDLTMWLLFFFFLSKDTISMWLLGAVHTDTGRSMFKACIALRRFLKNLCQPGPENPLLPCMHGPRRWMDGKSPAICMRVDRSP